MRRWYFSHARSVVYMGCGIAVVAVAAVARSDAPELGGALVEARQLYGLWALGLLLASLLIGPLSSVLPWLPLKAPLLYARRAVGISTMIFAVLHVACYLIAVIRRGWRELYTPGLLWVLGLLLGLTAFSDMMALAFTSTDASVKRLGGRRWKRLHRTIYVLLVIALLHAFLNGADFGFGRAPDVTNSPDAGALIGFLAVAAAWLVLFLLRRRGFRWTPKGLTINNCYDFASRSDNLGDGSGLGKRPA